MLSPVEPSSSSATAVVFTLLKSSSSSDLELLLESIKCTWAIIESYGSASVDHVVFIDGEIEPSPALTAFKERAPTTMFVNARLYGFHPPNVPIPSDSWPLGYRQMCDFMALRWFNALAKYKYAMRIDDDVCLLQLPIADPFEALANSGAVYMYGLLKEESHEETRATLTPWLKAYAREHNLAAAAVDADSIYFTNFFVSRVDFWTRPNVTEYLAAVDISRSIFTHRWGDAPLQTAALRLHAAPDAIHHLRMDYLHMSTRDYIVDGEQSRFPYGPAQSIDGATTVTSM